ncbi:DUF4350 domain-containing protein [Jinshanibacter sp. LJY008]|uniref:DUF4350 domain-containing protein n=1 Tax=Limnobaculum eriocheiris TaxID=2897391 RepID=A0A9X1SPL4_9GAMM|nr:DUF4350 domain-containing protein [Limnobaculum eriocheiris]MCD1126172.1 DUF4350 domain-containing protein [Limnobaculum eriocheiris]
MSADNAKKSTNPWLILTIIFAAIAGLAIYCYQQLEWEEREVTTLPSWKVIANNYYTAEQLLSKSGYQVKIVGDALSLNKLPAKSTLVLFNPDGLLKEPTQKTKLMDWVSKGGHLIISPLEDKNSVELQELFDIYLKDECDNDDKCESKKPSVDLITVKLPEKDTPDKKRDGMPILFEKDKMVADVTDTPRFYVDWKTTENVPESPKSEWDIISRFQLEQGWVTVVPLKLFGNDNIKQYDHAKLWLHIATLPDRNDVIYLVRYATLPNLLSWLVEHALYTLLAFGLCILLVLWRYIPRFGALIPTPPPTRPSLTEHLKAVADFHLNNYDYERLVAPLQEEVLRLLQPLRIQYPGNRSDAQLIEHITHYDLGLITQAMAGEVQHLNQFTQSTQTLCLLIDRLNSLQSSSSRRLNYGI